VTPKQRVQKRFPNAVAKRYGSTWMVTFGQWTRYGITAAGAWAGAAKKMRATKSAPDSGDFKKASHNSAKDAS
jgi:hypothetical protein